MKLIPAHLWHAPGMIRRSEPIAVADALADDALLWHLDEDGWD